MISDSHQDTDHQTMIPQRQQRQQKRLCDYCNGATALVYCRADSAKLCLGCDREVHSTNQLFSKHTRCNLCDACDASPASIFCETERSVLCQNCDWESHNLSSSCSVHHRRPIEGFSGCPSVTELLAILGFEDLGDEKDLLLSEGRNGLAVSEIDGSGLGDGYSDLFIWESPAIVSIDDFIVSGDSAQNLQALGIPPLPKNRNAACGRHEEEILRQLRELARWEPGSDPGKADIEPFNIFQSLTSEEYVRPGDMHFGCEPDSHPISFTGREENVLHWLNDVDEDANQVFLPSVLPQKNSEEKIVVPDNRSNINCSEIHANDGNESQTQHPVATRLQSSAFPKVASHELNSQERDSAISRYKEKKKTRRYGKQIRYESRKVRAEGRTRINGRFAKIDR